MSKEEEHTSLLAKVMAGMTKFEKEEGCLADWPDEKENEETGLVSIMKSTKNVLHFLTRFGITIRDDAFRWQYLLAGVPLRDQLDDKAGLDLMFAMDQCGLTIGKDKLWDTLQGLAHVNTTHELRDLFDDLEKAWVTSGSPAHLDTWLQMFAYVDANSYTSAIAAKPLIAAVRRVRHPGTAFKHMMVLEGPQDIRKSGTLRVLGLDQYFDDNLEFGASTKEIMEISSGVLIHEVAELSKMSDRAVETVKAMLSRQKDKARMAYGRATTQMARQFILIGTSNDRKYLKDPTGSVRFWPVWSNATAAKPIDTDGLAKVVRLMWGEAAARERAGESLFLEGEALRLAQVAQGERYAGDAIHDKISDALEGKEGFIPSVTVLDLCEITDEKLRMASTTAKSVTAAMTKNGWTPDRRRLHGRDAKVRGWAKGKLPTGTLDACWEWNLADRTLKHGLRAAA